MLKERMINVKLRLPQVREGATLTVPETKLKKEYDHEKENSQPCPGWRYVRNAACLLEVMDRRPSPTNTSSVSLALVSATQVFTVAASPLMASWPAPAPMRTR